MSSPSAHRPTNVHSGFQMTKLAIDPRKFNLMLATPEEYNAAKRLSDIVNGYAVAYPTDMLFNSWLAVRLSTGDTDGVMYDDRRAAVRHQSDEKLCAYLSLRFAVTGMTVKDAFLFLAYHRAAYDAGFRLPDPDDMNGGREMVMPIENEAMRGHIGRLLATAASKSRHYVN